MNISNVATHLPFTSTKQNPGACLKIRNICNSSKHGLYKKHGYYFFEDGMINLTPPDYTKLVKNCTYRREDGTCCHFLNYLRPHNCNHYCVLELDRWLRKEHPEMEEDGIVTTVAELTNPNPA